MTIKLKGSTDGSVSLDAPADTSPTGTDVSFTLPTADGTAGQVLSTNGSGALSFVNAITEVDQWRLQSNVTADGTLTDLVRNPEPSAAQIGTGMTVSSGVFTFPSTGKWLVLLSAFFVVDNSDSVLVRLNVTQDNSSYNTAAEATDGNNGTGERNGSGVAFHFMDVTDTSLVKVKFDAASITADSRVTGSSTVNTTTMLFVRLGDT